MDGAGVVRARSDEMDAIPVFAGTRFSEKIELETNRCRSGSFLHEMILIQCRTTQPGDHARHCDTEGRSNQASDTGVRRFSPP
jgi:hypothetical protein